MAQKNRVKRIYRLYTAMKKRRLRILQIYLLKYFYPYICSYIGVKITRIAAIPALAPTIK